MSTPESNEDFAKHAAAAMRIKVKTESLNRAILEAVAQGLRVQAALVGFCAAVLFVIPFFQP